MKSHSRAILEASGINAQACIKNHFLTLVPKAVDLPSLIRTQSLPKRCNSSSLESLTHQLGDEALIKLTRMTTYKLVSIRMTTKSVLHENANRSICTRYE